MLCRLEEVTTGEAADRDGFFGNHPLPLSEFLRNMDFIGEPCKSFLDIGSGAGTKLLLARYLGWSEVAGVERDPQLSEFSRRLVPEAMIIDGDAFDVEWGDFDVVYSYRLCQDLKRQDELAAHIYEMAEPGTLIVYPGAEFPFGEYLGESVWRV